jgi:methyl-accepting chemotaxis protein
MKKYVKKTIVLFLSHPFIQKIRVFHLILIIIAVMVTFTAIQGYMVLNFIDSQQKVNQKMFNSAVQFRNETDDLKSDLLFIRENYLKRLSKLADSSSLDYTFNSIDKNIENIKQITKTTSSNSRIAELISDPAKDLSETLEKLKILAYAADTKENFLECETELFRALKDIGNIQTQVQESSYNTSTDSKNASQNQRTMAILLLVSGTCIAVIIGIFINFSISWPMQEIIKAGRAMAAGDFTQKISSFGCRESYEVVEELNASFDSLRLLIGQLNQQSDQIAQASQNLKTAANDSGCSAEEVAKAMQQLAYASSNQAEQVTQTAGTVNKLGAKVRDVSAKTLDIANSSEQVALTAQGGHKLTNDVADEINQIYLATNEIGNVIQELDEASKVIAEISSEIREITDETSLLSLNASIEASRAGEHGKGFSVVAHSIGRLAERCRSAAQKIDDLTDHMMERAEQAVRIRANGVARVEDGKNLAGEAAITFEDIFNKLKLTLEKINDVAKAAQEMSEDNEKVLVAVASIAAISEESMASSEEVSASAEEQNAAAQEVTLLAENLLTISNEMKQSANVFKI